VRDESVEVELPAPPAVRWLVRTLEEAGYETWAVGGAVRDELRGILSADWDFATRARPRQLRSVFRRTVPVGVEHGTVGVLARDGVMYEVTTFRRDVETDGRHATVVFADSLDDDLARRDFTINAVAWHPLRKEIRDPFGGRRDLREGILRTVGEPRERFAEDRLRILRALRFAGRFRMVVEADTWAALTAGVDGVRRLSPERVREELLKVLGGPGLPSDALELYRRSGALAVVAPELRALATEHWSRTVAEVDALPPHRPWLRLAALMARAGEPPETPDDPGADSVKGLEAADPAAARGARRTVALLSRLRASNAQVARTSALVAAGRTPPDPADEAELRRWLARVGPEHLNDVARLWIARRRVLPDTVADPLPAIRALRRLLRTEPALTVGDLVLDGRDLIRLGLRPGPHFGRILATLLEEVLEDPAHNRRDYLKRRALEIAAASPEKPHG
jgi:tRNA nucleotidyltransferase (CCA-adding enzyme)